MKHNDLNQIYWDIITAEFADDGAEDEANELFGHDQPLYQTIPECFAHDEE